MIRVFQAISDPATCHAVVAKREGGSGDEIPLSFRGNSWAKKTAAHTFVIFVLFVVKIVRARFSWFKSWPTSAKITLLNVSYIDNN